MVSNRVITGEYLKGIPMPEGQPITDIEDGGETFCFQGGPIKAIDGEEGKIGGYIVLFSSANDPDLSGDYFTKATDFGIHRRVPILWNHGKDKALGTKSLGVMTTSIDDVGVWAEGVIELRGKYEKAIYELAKAGKLGWSTGSAPHVVEREQTKGGASWIKSWPLGLDASLTPSPVEPRTGAIALKSLPVVDIDALIEEVKGMPHSDLHNRLQEELAEHGYVSDVDDKYAYVHRMNGAITAHKYKENEGNIKVDKEGKKARMSRSYMVDDGENKSLTLSQETNLVLATVESFAARIADLKALRSSESRPMSLNALKSLDEVLTVLEELKASCQPKPSIDVAKVRAEAEELLRSLS